MKVALHRIDDICLAKRSASPTLARRHIGDMWQESWAACSGPHRHLSPPNSSLKAMAIANWVRSFGFPLVQQQTEDGPVRVGRNVLVHAFSAPSWSCPDLQSWTKVLGHLHFFAENRPSSISPSPLPLRTRGRGDVTLRKRDPPDRSVSINGMVTSASVLSTVTVPISSKRNFVGKNEHLLLEILRNDLSSITPFVKVILVVSKHRFNVVPTVLTHIQTKVQRRSSRPPARTHVRCRIGTKGPVFQWDDGVGNEACNPGRVSAKWSLDKHHVSNRTRNILTIEA